MADMRSVQRVADRAVTVDGTLPSQLGRSELKDDVRFLLSLIDAMDEADCTVSELDPEDLVIIAQMRRDYYAAK